MHITTQMAGLLAQVFPVLLIAILLEGGFRITRRRKRWVIMALAVVRILAVFSAVGATFACLYGFIYGVEHMVIDVFVNLGFGASLVAIMVMVGDVMDRQVEDAQRALEAEDAADRDRPDQWRVDAQRRW